MSSDESEYPPAKIALISFSTSVEPCQTQSSLTGTDLKCCVICQASKRDRRNRRRLEELVGCEGDSKPATLGNAAEIRREETILLEIEHEDLWQKLYYITAHATSTLSRQALCDAF